LQTHTVGVAAPRTIDGFMHTIRGDLMIIGCDHPGAATWATAASDMAAEMLIPSRTHLVRGGVYALMSPESSLRKLMRPDLLKDCVAEAERALSELLSKCGTPSTYLLVGHGPCLQYCCPHRPDPSQEARLLTGATSRLSDELLLRAASDGVLAAVSSINARGAGQDPFRHVCTRRSAT
jgi:hypothetical protein